jgi:serine/threonine-protein kinase
MPAPSVTALVGALRQYRLLEPISQEELASLQERFTDPKALAQELMRRGWLTAFQANLLLQGRGGELVLGGYVLLERIGEGGMGQVYKARHLRMRRVVALKLIHPDRLGNPQAVQRFEREVRAAAALAHPNIVLAYDANEVNGRHLLAMEYVEGTDLAASVAKGGVLPVAQACDCIRQAALGLQHAHERGLVHRDIKPHNLLLTPDGVVKILDMGLARLNQPGEPDDRRSAMTQEGTVLGTPDYMAPEQANDSSGADIRADLYSLGCTLYFLLTGQPPFPGGGLTDKLVRHQLHEPEPVEHLRPDVSPAVAAIVRKMMAKKPEERFQTPAEVAGALQRVQATPPAGGATAASQAPVPRRPPAPRPELLSTLEVVEAGEDLSGKTAPERPRKKSAASTLPRRRAIWPLALGAGLGLVVVVAVALALALPSRKPDTGAAAVKAEESKPAPIKPAPVKPFEEHEFIGKALKGVKLDGLECSARVAGKASVEGDYAVPAGTLRLAVEGGTLKIAGACNRVIVDPLTMQGRLDLKRLKIGAGGVTIKNMAHISHLHLGDCQGKVVIRTMDSISTLHYRRGTVIEGRENVRGLAKLDEED